MDRSEGRMIQLQYASSATVPFGEEELQSLLHRARERNAAVDVSGLLLYHEGNFLQLLEGPKDAVQSLFRRINGDARHKNVLILSCVDIQERDFAGWSMGYQRLRAEQLDEGVPGFTDLMESDSPEPELLEQVSQRVRSLVLSFREMSGARS